MNEKLFALDIGTRSVVGIILEKVGDFYRIADHITEEHTERSMLDGQIHDVVAVSQVITKVKERLEVNHGPLKKVCVAAAGRALRTKKTEFSQDVYQQPLMTREDIIHLELNAVQQAQYQLAQKTEESQGADYYCVGYSVLHYHIDGQKIGSLIDQQGQIAQVEIIATFLPKVVVDSLLSALGRAKLAMEALTLEPIAAIQVLIPPSMRRLNVALVDIGAGTSDIAITNSGTVIAYGMVPSAGDSVTEAISDEYLLDFPDAERAKRELTTKGFTSITDILGLESTIQYAEAVSKIEDSLKSLAEQIATEILQLNQTAPKAVMLVGGGSQTPELSKYLAESMGVPANRIAIRGIRAIQQLEDHEQLPHGPELVTPIGIAIAAKQNPIQYKNVIVNGQTIRLFDMKQLTVGDCILAAGIELSKLYGKPGEGLMIELNGKTLPLEGALGSPPCILRNGTLTSIESPVSEGDHIGIEQGRHGQTPDLTVEDLIGDFDRLHLTYNHEFFSFTQPVVFVNGTLVQADCKVKDQQQIEYFPVTTLTELKKVLTRINKWVEPASSSHYVRVNQHSFELTPAIAPLLINGESGKMEDLIKHEDIIDTKTNRGLPLRSVLEQLDKPFLYEIEVFFNNKPISLKQALCEVKRNGENLSEEDLVFPNDRLIITEKEKEPFIFQDIFKWTDIQLSSIPARYKIYRNETVCTFNDTIVSGDRLSIDMKY